LPISYKLNKFVKKFAIKVEMLVNLYHQLNKRERLKKCFSRLILSFRNCSKRSKSVQSNVWHL